jgi:hypothetical protein
MVSLLLAQRLAVAQLHLGEADQLLVEHRNLASSSPNLNLSFSSEACLPAKVPALVSRNFPDWCLDEVAQQKGARTQALLIWAQSHQQTRFSVAYLVEDAFRWLSKVLEVAYQHPSVYLPL